MEDFENAAIRAALCGHWSEAINLNLKILKKNKKDIAALNRLTRSYLEINKKGLAKKNLAFTLKIDPYNQIAIKLKARLSSKSLPREAQAQWNPTSSARTTFIEEPGTTQTVTLINLAPPKILASLECAQSVCLVPKHHSVHICQNDRYLGSLPDDLGKRLYLLIKNGNCYEAFIKAVGPQILTIFVRELSRCKRYHSLASFTQKSDTYRHIEEPIAEHPKEDDEDTLSSSKSVAIHQDEEPEEGA